MLAKLTEALPAGPGFIYEPKWDGFRARVFRGGGDVYIQSRDLRPLDGVMVKPASLDDRQH